MGVKKSQLVVPGDAAYGLQKTTITPGNSSPILSGPPAGFIRVFDMEGGPGLNIELTAEPPTPPDNAPFQVSVVGPFGTLLLNDSSVSNQYDGYAGVTWGVSLAPGEYLSLANLSGALTIYVRANYIDYPATGVTLVRALTNGTTPVTIIPSPPVGKLHCPWIPPIFGMESDYSFRWFNRDTIQHGLDAKCGGANAYYIETGAGPAAGSDFSITQRTIRNGETFTVELLEATTTTEGILLGAYQAVSAL
jgi:hypothetical protein